MSAAAATPAAEDEEAGKNEPAELLESKPRKTEGQQQADGAESKPEPEAKAKTEEPEAEAEPSPPPLTPNPASTEAAEVQEVWEKR